MGSPVNRGREFIRGEVVGDEPLSGSVIRSFVRQAAQKTWVTGQDGKDDYGV